MKKIIFSLAIVAMAAAVVIGGTTAFFSDTETSSGNTFTAGAIDLKVDSECTYNGVESDQCGTWGQNEEGIDITSEKFFNFGDLKPGDYGENTISLHVISNEARACVIMDNLHDDDLGLTEPESELDQTDGPGNGELSPEIYFFAWADLDGDNVWEDGETPLFGNISGPASDVLNGKAYDLGLLPADVTSYIGLYWCYGDIDVNQNDYLLTCDGAPVTNMSQTDSLTGDIWFYVEQSRNNPNFTCPDPREPAEIKIGANLGEYVPLDDCAIRVGFGETYTTIQAGVDAASEGQIVCVAAGTYDEDVLINKSIHLSGDGASATSVINGQSTAYTGAVLVASGVNNVTVEGFEINGAGKAAVYLVGDNSNVDIRYNKLRSSYGGVATALLSGGQQNGNSASNNVFIGDNASIVVYINGEASLGGANASSNFDFVSNTFEGTLGGTLVFGLEAANSNVNSNVFDITGTYAVVEAWKDTIVLNSNNLNQGGDVRNGDTGTLNAENNWWGDNDPSDQVAGTVDYDPFALAAFPEN